MDGRRSLIASANVTDRGQSRNIEAGVRVTDTELAAELVAHWRALAKSDLLRRYLGAAP